MQEVFIGCVPSTRATAQIIADSLGVLDSVQVCIEECDPGHLPEVCEAAGENDGIILLLSPDAVPRDASRTTWSGVLQRLEHTPASIASVLLGPCPFPPALTSRGLQAGLEEARRALVRWTIALDTAAPDRFEPVDLEEQYDFRDVVWIPCANRSRTSVEEDLRHAVDGRRVLVLLDSCSPDITIPPLTREVIRQAPPPPAAPDAHEIPSILATCYPDFLYRDFAARLANVEPSALTGCLSPLTRDNRILRVPVEARRRLAADAAPRRRHAELVREYLMAPDAPEHLRMLRLELPAALEFAYLTDWNFAAGLAWRANQLLRETWPRQAAELLLRLRDSAAEKSVRSWVDLAERELRWLGVDIPPPPGKTKSKADQRQMKLDW